MTMTKGAVHIANIGNFNIYSLIHRLALARVKSDEVGGVEFRIQNDLTSLCYAHKENSEELNATRGCKKFTLRVSENR